MQNKAQLVRNCGFAWLRAPCMYPNAFGVWDFAQGNVMSCRSKCIRRASLRFENLVGMQQAVWSKVFAFWPRNAQ